MKKIIFLLLLVSPVQARPPQVSLPPLQYEPPQAERFVLTNGVIVYSKANHELPLVQWTLRLKSSPTFEPKPDTFELLATAWRTGGTQHISSSELDRLLENKAISISISVDEETCVVACSTLKKNSEEALALYFDLLFHPRFENAPFQLIKAQTLEGIRRQDESIGDMARRAFRDAIFGSTHVYAQNPTQQTIQGLSVSDMKKAHAALLDPQRAILAVSGDIDESRVETEWNKRMEGWNPKRVSLPPYDYSLKNPAPDKIIFIDKDFSQSRIIFGRTGPSRHNPDQYALRMADAVLGGGGPSRLFGEIRSRLGLAYVVGSVYSEREGPGTIAVVCQTQAPATVQSLQAIEKELDKFTRQPPSVSELDIAKESTINSFVFGFLTSADITNAWAVNEFYGYSKDYLSRFTKNIAALNPNDIFQVAKKYYSAADMKVVIVGSRKKIGPSLDTLGKIKEIPLEKLD